MMSAMFLTSAGRLGLSMALDEGLALVVSLMAAVVYALGAVC